VFVLRLSGGMDWKGGSGLDQLSATASSFAGQSLSKPS
jgi:hypothetical protein